MHFCLLIYSNNLFSTCFEYSNYSSLAGSYCICNMVFNKHLHWLAANTARVDLHFVGLYSASISRCTVQKMWNEKDCVVSVRHNLNLKKQMSKHNTKDSKTRWKHFNRRNERLLCSNNKEIIHERYRGVVREYYDISPQPGEWPVLLIILPHKLAISLP